MAEQLLHGAQIGAVLQQMAGKGVAEHMRAISRAGRCRRAAASAFRSRAKTLPRQMAALAGRGKQPIFARRLPGWPAVFGTLLVQRRDRGEIRRIARFEDSFSGTIRSLLPLPRTTMNRSSRRATETGSDTSSETRRPVA